MVSRGTVAASAAGFGSVTVVAVKKTAKTVTKAEAKPLSKAAQNLQSQVAGHVQGSILVLTVTSWETLQSLFGAAEELRLSSNVTYPVVMIGESRIMTSGQYVSSVWNPAVLKKKLPYAVTIKISGRRNRTGKVEALPTPEAKVQRTPRAPRAKTPTTPTTPTTEA